MGKGRGGGSIKDRRRLSQRARGVVAVACVEYVEESVENGQGEEKKKRNECKGINREKEVAK